MHRLTARILDVSDSFLNTNFPIYERFCVSPQPYYLNWFERSYPIVPITRYDGPFCLQFMNWIQEIKPSGRQCNRLLDAVVTILKYKKSTIDHVIYIKVFTYGRVSYITISTDGVINTTNNETAFP